MSLRERLAERVRALEGVQEGMSRVGNPEHVAWFAGRREFAHMHSETVLDARVPRRHQAAWRDDPRTIVRSGSSAWMEFRLDAAEDIEDAFALVKLAWEDARS